MGRNVYGNNGLRTDVACPDCELDDLVEGQFFGYIYCYQLPTAEKYEINTLLYRPINNVVEQMRP